MSLLDQINVTSIENIHTVSSPRGRFLEIHQREYYGLSFCTEGQITYTHNGKEFVSDPSHAVFLPQGQSYVLYGNKKGFFPLIDFTCTDFPVDTIHLIPLQNPESFFKDYEQMRELFLFQRNRLRVLSIFYDILNRLTLHESREDTLLSNAIRYLENNISDPGLSNQVLAQQIGFSEIYFRKLFCAQYGMSPRQYILEIRMQKAKQLLAGGTMSIGGVAEECGFTNVYHFSRAFKSRVGVTPSQYMRDNKLILL